jgi:hypothetical protein
MKPRNALEQQLPKGIVETHGCTIVWDHIHAKLT